MWYDTVDATQLAVTTQAWYALRKDLPTPPKTAGAVAKVRTWLQAHNVSADDACLLSTWIGTGRAALMPRLGPSADIVEALAGASGTAQSSTSWEPGTREAEEDCGTEGGFLGWGARTVYEAWADAAKHLPPVVSYDLARWGEGKAASALATVKANANQDAVKIAKEAAKTAGAAIAGAGLAYSAAQALPIIAAAIAAKAIA